MSKDQKPFYTGLITGIAILAVIGFVGMSFAYFNKSNTATPAGTTNTQATSPTPTNNTAASKIDIQVTPTDHVRGNSNAPVTIVEYSDYQCPYCARFQTTMQTVMQNYPDQVRWVYRHFPLTSLHPFALQAAEAAECAGAQGKYWEYSDQLFANQDKYSSDYFTQLAQELNLDTGQFSTCVSSNRYSDVINSDAATGKQYGITGTPGFFVNGTLYKGALPYTQVKTIIDNALSN